MERVSKINYYLDIAEAVLRRGTCTRKNYGCIIVKNDEIISTGYTGAPRGRKNCIDLGYCTKKKFFPDVRHGGYDACRSVHAEQNAMLSASRKDMIDSSMFLVGIRQDTGTYEDGASPCQICRKLIINSGIKYVYVRIDKEHYEQIVVENWIKEDDSLNGITTY
ncbi:MAG: cytidine deaminase [Clostridia bacterium]|nr:cytidine deaminase [Clostridia bacterium]